MKTFSKLITVFLLTLLFSLILVKHSFAVSLDSTFGTNGKVITTYGHESYISKTVLQTGEKIISVGAASNGSNLDWAVAQYDSDGSLDTNFGTGGIVLKDFGGDDAISSIKIQSGGKIIVGGFSHIAANFQWTLARFNSNGLIDNSFGINGNGLVTTFTGIHSVLNSILLQPDEKIIAIGYSQNQGQDELAIARYNPDGSPDITFGPGGTVTTPIGNSNDRGNAVALQSDGKIVVFGDFDAGGHDNVFLARFTANGALDTLFGTGGIVKDNYEYHNGARDIALQSDGKILITGATKNNSGSLDTYIARYDSTGALDGTFGSGGKTIISFASGDDVANSLLLQPDGKMILGGYENVGGSSGTDFALRRFKTDGTLDTEFGSNGYFVTPIGSGNDAINGIALQNNGKIIAAGTAYNGTHNDWALARYQFTPSTALTVPLLKQGIFPFNDNIPSWESQEYDHATKNAGFGCGTTIAQCGCALTSLAMILQYYKVEKLPNGTLLDPGTFNTWLKNNNGYLRDQELNPYTAPLVAVKAKSQNPEFKYDGIEYTQVTADDKAQLTSDLQNGWPIGLQEPGHFIVATGFDGDNFSINDPAYYKTSLKSYDNKFLTLERYIPSKTDLSYMVFAVDKNINIIMKDSAGNEVGKSYINQPIYDATLENPTIAPEAKLKILAYTNPPPVYIKLK